MKIANGLILDFDPGAAGGTDTFLMRNTTTGLVTELSSVPASRVSAGGNLTEATSSVLTITGGTGAVLSGLTIQVKLAGAAQSGYLSTTDWNTFNNKQSTTLANGSMWVGNGSGVATAVTMSGDVTITNAGVASITANSIVNADINSAAAIAFSKMAALTVNLVLGSNGSGVVTTITGFTTTIAGYLTNITSDVQAQFTTTNQRIVNIATNAIVRTPTTTQNGYAIIWDNTAAEWTLGPVGGGGSVTGAGSSTDNAITRWNGTGGTSIQDSGVIIDDTNNITGVATLTLGTAGLHLLDTNASHDLILSVGSDLTVDRTLTVTTGDADRTLTLSGNATLNDWFDQSVKTTASPVFADVTVSNLSGLHILDSDSSHDLVIRTTSNLTADRELIFVTGDAARTLTINASGTLYVTGGTDVAVADGGTGLSAIAALSILVANSANTFVALTPGAGNSLRVNAGGTAWEAYTPGGGVSGLTANRVPYAASATTLTDSASLTWDNTNSALTVGSARIHSTGSNNIFYGDSAGNFTLTGAHNIGIGNASLDALTTANFNVAIGTNTLTSNLSGAENVAVGTDALALYTGNYNVAVGGRALDAATTGQQNIAVGYNALGAVVDGNANVAIGDQAGDSITSGDENIAIGQLALGALSIGNSNIAIGSGAGDNITTGSTNVIIGYNIDAQSISANGQLSIQNAIFGLSNTATGTALSTGTLGVYVVDPTASLDIAAGTTAKASLRIRKGVAPTTPNDGDIWYDDAAETLHVRINGVTKTFTVT